jgi:hypothetical protein
VNGICKLCKGRQFQLFEIAFTRGRLREKVFGDFKRRNRIPAIERVSRSTSSRARRKVVIVERS